MTGSEKREGKPAPEEVMLVEGPTRLIPGQNFKINFLSILYQMKWLHYIVLTN